jgi:protein subunit release factor A
MAEDDADLGAVEQELADGEARLAELDSSRPPPRTRATTATCRRRAGAGGEEAALFARACTMYARYAERHRGTRKS